MKFGGLNPKVASDPPYLKEANRLMIDESDVEYYTATLHGTTQTHCSILDKATGNAIASVQTGLPLGVKWVTIAAKQVLLCPTWY